MTIKKLANGETWENIKWRAFVDKYKPIPNGKGSKYDSSTYMFNLNDEDLKKMQKIVDDFAKKEKTGDESYHVWTMMDDDYISNGRHFINRFAYLVTKVPYSKTGDVQVDFR